MKANLLWLAFFVFFRILFGGKKNSPIFAPSLRGRAEVARRAHNPKVSGSNPLLATKWRYGAAKETKKEPK